MPNAPLLMRADITWDSIIAAFYKYPHSAVTMSVAVPLDPPGKSPRNDKKDAPGFGVQTSSDTLVALPTVMPYDGKLTVAIKSAEVEPYICVAVS